MFGKENPQGDSVLKCFSQGAGESGPRLSSLLLTGESKYPEASNIPHLFQSLLSVYDFVLSPFLKIYFIQSLNDPIILVFLFMYSFIQHTHRLSIFCAQDIVCGNCPCGPKKKF